MFISIPLLPYLLTLHKNDKKEIFLKKKKNNKALHREDRKVAKSSYEMST